MVIKNKGVHSDCINNATDVPVCNLATFDILCKQENMMALALSYHSTPAWPNRIIVFFYCRGG